MSKHYHVITGMGGGYSPNSSLYFDSAPNRSPTTSVRSQQKGNDDDKGHFDHYWHSACNEAVYHRHAPDDRTYGWNVPVASIVQSGDTWFVTRYDDVWTGPTPIAAIAAFLAVFHPAGIVA